MWGASWKSCFDTLFRNTGPSQVFIMLALFISLFWCLTISIRAAAFCPWPNSGSRTHIHVHANCKRPLLNTNWCCLEKIYTCIWAAERLQHRQGAFTSFGEKFHFKRDSPRSKYNSTLVSRRTQFFIIKTISEPYPTLQITPLLKLLHLPPIKFEFHSTTLVLPFWWRRGRSKLLNCSIPALQVGFSGPQRGVFLRFCVPIQKLRVIVPSTP